MAFAVVAFLIMSVSIGELQTGRMYPGRARRAYQSSHAANGHTSYKILKSTLKHCLHAFGDSPLVHPMVNVASVKRVLSRLPGARALYGNSEWDRKHPFDRAYGTDTSGFLCGEELLTGHPAEAHGSPYAGAQPSVMRTVFATLPHNERSTFIDLGCGKGRPMLVASEFSFRDIVGVELSPPLVEAARRNAAVMAKRFPHRTPIRVDEGDATTYPMPAGDVVLFIYNSFDHELMQKVADGVEVALKFDGQRSIYVVYCNPVSGDCFDESPLLTRRFAQTLRYAAEEQGFAPDTRDAVIVWQGGNAPRPDDAKIVIVRERWRAELSV
ncbi:MAG TPA: class I SAM-dependent methyltransferase [Candidatus Acidoferrum sp.]|nr:class I SAM-dependent methyltransferase [Candidatus Acidoferrum sp.]